MSQIATVTHPRPTVGIDRRLALLQRSGLFGDNARGASVLRATSLEDLFGAYRLTHDLFLEHGYIVATEDGIRIRPYELLEDTATFIAKTEDDVVGVTTVVMDSPEFGLPTDSAFKQEIDALRQNGRKVCEGTNWLVADSHRSSAVMTELMRCSLAHAMVAGCTDFVGTVSPGHAKFYTLLGFDILGGPRNYSEEIYDPVVSVRVDVAAFSERFMAVDVADADIDAEAFIAKYFVIENPYLDQIAAWQMQAARFFQSPEQMSVLFTRHSRALRDCTRVQLDAIRRRWGGEVFDTVWADAGLTQ